MTSYHTSVLYPNNDDTTFDLQFYLDKHMPLVDRLWKPLGLLKWEIVEYTSAGEGKKSPYRVGAHLTWKDEKSFISASKSAEATEIFADVPKFCNVQPSFLIGKLVGGS